MQRQVGRARGGGRGREEGSGDENIRASASQGHNQSRQGRGQDGRAQGGVEATAPGSVLQDRRQLNQGRGQESRARGGGGDSRGEDGVAETFDGANATSSDAQSSDDGPEDGVGEAQVEDQGVMHHVTADLSDGEHPCKIGRLRYTKRGFLKGKVKWTDSEIPFGYVRKSDKIGIENEERDDRVERRASNLPAPARPPASSSSSSCSSNSDNDDDSNYVLVKALAAAQLTAAPEVIEAIR
ncbi:hypothetical protein PHYSODRAFT_340849 [Phytophthora sojae]|uniref:Uncharacterized protein n=1 Tax=Phytophthora sojae (strain P6497) TaxID=1094619 RepID=G5ACV7_PHYSP|nr:hypothetical protein PHYSODRAFT_340849 [Phytophthora sojae]EGZ06619.1 hypothetical protein PHYSODRAFT_340849 [Phytophthora sojae]|eukprot:XP_009537383.1 hypothetical protein PHYSODRAFT_340849 [Phytophthora sojae]